MRCLRCGMAGITGGNPEGARPKMCRYVEDSDGPRLKRGWSDPQRTLRLYYQVSLLKHTHQSNYTTVSTEKSAEVYLRALSSIVHPNQTLRRIAR